jgi:hypothetical protein
LPPATQPTRMNSLYPISALYPSLLESSFMHTFNVAQQPPEVQLLLFLK